LEGRELEFYRWEGDVPELMKDVREKLNMLGEVNTCAVMSNWFARRFFDTYQLGV
jgi:hypothetical protein